MLKRELGGHDRKAQCASYGRCSASGELAGALKLFDHWLPPLSKNPFLMVKFVGPRGDTRLCLHADSTVSR